MYLCGPGKHSCQPFCGPEGWFYCSDSVCSLWPAPFSYLCVRVSILGVLKIVCGWASKTWLLPYACCGLHFTDSAACVLSFDHSTPFHIYILFMYIYIYTHTWSIVCILRHAEWCTKCLRGHYNYSSLIINMHLSIVNSQYVRRENNALHDFVECLVL